MKDLISNIGAALALAPAVQSAAANGAAIDTQGFRSLVFVVNTGAVAGDGDFGLKVQESDTSVPGDFTDAAADDVRGTIPATLEASTAYRVGYAGSKRYVRLALTKAGGTSIAAGAVAVLGNPAIAPVA